MMNFKKLNVLLVLAGAGSMGNIWAMLLVPITQSSPEQQEIALSEETKARAANVVRVMLGIAPGTCSDEQRKNLGNFFGFSSGKSAGMGGLVQPLTATPFEKFALKADRPLNLSFDLEPIGNSFPFGSSVKSSSIITLNADGSGAEETLTDTIGVDGSRSGSSSTKITKAPPVNAWSKKKIGLAVLAVAGLAFAAYQGRVSLKSMITSFWK